MKNINKSTEKVNKYEVWDFPEKVGSKTQMDNPVIEFVKYLFEILSLDGNVFQEIIVLKRNCMKILKISEYSE